MIQTSLGPLEAVLELTKGHKSWFSARNFQNSSEIHPGTPGGLEKSMENHEKSWIFFLESTRTVRPCAAVWWRVECP